MPEGYRERALHGRLQHEETGVPCERVCTRRARRLTSHRLMAIFSDGASTSDRKFRGQTRGKAEGNGGQ